MNAKSLLLSTLALALLGLVMTNCRPTYPKCDNDEHCSEQGEFCVNGLCQKCRDNSNCGACQQCTAGQCTAVIGCCQSEQDCAAGQKCRDGFCGPQCLGNNECGERQACQGGRCVPAACFNNGECPAGSECVNYNCVAVAAPPCELERVHFDFDSYSLRPDAKSTLDGNAQCVRQKSISRVVVEGHCDERGTEEYNLALGDRRARAAKDYLQRLGVGGLRSVSYGENQPLTRGHGEDAWSENRRAEFRAE